MGTYLVPPWKTRKRRTTLKKRPLGILCVRQFHWISKYWILHSATRKKTIQDTRECTEWIAGLYLRKAYELLANLVTLIRVSGPFTFKSARKLESIADTPGSLFWSLLICHCTKRLQQGIEAHRHKIPPKKKERRFHGTRNWQVNTTIQITF